MRADLEFGQDSAARGLEGWLDWFGPDAAVFPASERTVVGLEAVRAFYTGTGFTPEGLTWQPIEARISRSGDLGYTLGTWKHVGAGPDGERSETTGKYLTVWRRQGDGTWKVEADIGAPDLRPAESRPAGH